MQCTLVVAALVWIVELREQDKNYLQGSDIPISLSFCDIFWVFLFFFICKWVGDKVLIIYSVYVE